MFCFIYVYSVLCVYGVFDFINISICLFAFYVFLVFLYTYICMCVNGAQNGYVVSKAVCFV